MSCFSFLAMDSSAADALRAGGPDANGFPAERTLSDGEGNPCRHCLRDIPAGKPMLILAYRPFATRQPYAETGPVFLCAEACVPHPDGADLPPVIASRPRFLVRAYGADERIRYGTGGIVGRDELLPRLAELFSEPMNAFIDIRSAVNGCFQCRVIRAD